MESFKFSELAMQSLAVEFTPRSLMQPAFVAEFKSISSKSAFVQNVN
jgi:hypothetical protein